MDDNNLVSTKKSSGDPPAAFLRASGAEEIKKEKMVDYQSPLFHIDLFFMGSFRISQFFMFYL